MPRVHPAMIVPASLHHAAEVAAALREQDRFEVESFTGKPAEVVVADSVANTSRPLAMIGPSGLAIGVGGISGKPGGVGFPWMLGTNELTDHKLLLVRTCRSVLAAERGRFTSLVNFAYSDNDPALSLIRRLGFATLPPCAMGVRGDDFTTFYLEE